MGWAERLNPKSDWTLRNARRIVAQNEERERKERVKKAAEELKIKLEEELKIKLEEEENG
jgi:hypothetical protein